MCFSATASFSAGTVLLVIGSLAWRSAQRRCERPFAAIPLLFALQQFIEGTIWIAFDHDMPALNAVSTGAYLFFSHLLWPVFVPSAVLLIEPQARRRRALGAFVIAGGLVSIWLMYTMATYGIGSRRIGRHIEYVTPHVLGESTMTLYLLSTSVCMLLSSHRTVKTFGLLALASFGIAYGVYATWFISVWCYFAALLSGVVLWHFGSRVDADESRIPETIPIGECR